MGCDIHLFVEERVDGVWTMVIPKKGYREERLGRWEINRNYDLFTILANVRSRRADIRPISDPKGFPEDVSEDVMSVYDQWSIDAHTPSYLTLRELVEFDWVGQSVESGQAGKFGHMVDAVHYAHALMCHALDPDGAKAHTPKFVRNEFTEDYLKTTHFIRQMERHVIVGEETAKKYREEPWYDESFKRSDSKRSQLFKSVLEYYRERHDPTLDHMYEEQMLVYAEWTETYASLVGSFYSEVIPTLKELGSPDDIRIVFFFDN